ncbi:hypothetical protein [Massilia sp. METH4]|uniref:hypothetical protein n=1 Tax=Massilia sp. METH4 TaxID=3123041 RepID=UPI0030CCE2E2
MFTPPRLRIRHAPARLLALAAALLLSQAAHALAGAEFRERSVIGKWKLVSLLDMASIASLDEAEAKTLLGKYVTITASSVKVDEEICAAPEFWAERIMPEPHIQEKLHTSAERLRLPSPAIMVELGCTDVYIRNPRQMVLLWGGAMFEAERIVAAPAPKPSRRRPPQSSRQARPARTRQAVLSPRAPEKRRPGRPAFAHLGRPPRRQSRSRRPLRRNARSSDAPPCTPGACVLCDCDSRRERQHGAIS